MTNEMVSDIGEFDLISRFTKDLVMSPAVSIGPGDDAAVFLVNGSAVTTVDMLVEGVHFRRDWCSGEDTGRKTVGANVADLEAMGASPLTLVVAVAMPKDLPVSWVKSFFAGLKDEANLANITLVGGDLTASEKIVVCATAIGQTDGNQPVQRSGAQIGDQIAIRGRFGWAAAGYAALSHGFRSPRAVVNAYRYPEVPYGAGRQAQNANAHAMMDVSDGLLADLEKIAQASQVTIDLNSDAFEIPDPLRAVGAAINIDPLSFVLTGGEDHGLVASFNKNDVPAGWRVVGSVIQTDTPTVLVDSKTYPGRHGWVHFLG